MIVVLCAFIIVCSMFFMIGVDLRVAQEIFFQLGGVSIFLFYMFFHRKDKISKIFALFCMYNIIQVLLTGAKSGQPVLFHILTATLLYYTVLHVPVEKTRTILKCVLWVGVINMLYIPLQLFGLDPIYSFIGLGVPDAVGMSGLKAVVGMWSALGMIIMSTINPFIGLGFLIPMYTSQSTGAILGLVLGVGFYWFYMNRKAFKIVIPLFIALSVLYIAFVDSPMGMMGTRPPMWKQAVKDTVWSIRVPNQSPYLRNILTGYGGGSFKNGVIRYYMNPVTQETIRGVVVNGKLVDSHGVNFTFDGTHVYYKGQRLDRWDNPHNEYIRLIFEFGLIGMVLFGAFLYFMWRRFYFSWKSKELIVITSLLIAFGAFATVQFPFSLARIGYLVPILIGLFVVNTEEE